MEIKDLRIGNYYIGYDDKVKQVDLGVFYLLFNDVDLDEIIKAPVNLTEEWLINLGFTKDNWTDKGRIIGTWFSNDGVLITSEHYLDSYDECGKIEYVHQLQNLYSALTGNNLSNISDTNTIS